MLCLFIHVFTYAFQAAPFHLGPVSLITFLYACFISYFVAFPFICFWLGCCPYSFQGPSNSWFKLLVFIFLNSPERTGQSFEQMPITVTSSFSMQVCVRPIPSFAFLKLFWWTFCRVITSSSLLVMISTRNICQTYQRCSQFFKEITGKRCLNVTYHTQARSGENIGDAKPAKAYFFFFLAFIFI